MGLLNDKDLDKYLALIGTFFACELRDKQDDAFANETYRLFCAVREHIYTLMKNNEWVSVKDRLPTEATGCVLVCMPKESHSRVRTGQYSEYSKQWYIGDMCGVGGDEPIAWMPLPDPPKEVSE